MVLQLLPIGYLHVLPIHILGNVTKGIIVIFKYFLINYIINGSTVVYIERNC